MSLKDIQIQLTKKLAENKIVGKFERLDQVFEDKTRLAIDIGAYSVKAVQVKMTPSGSVVTNVGYKEIHEEGAKSSADQDNQLVNALTALLSDFKVKTKDIRVVLSDPGIYSRHITVPRVAEEELIKSIKWQAEKYTPFAIDDAIVDFQNLASNSNIDESQMEVVIVATERKTIDRYLSVLKRIKIVPAIIDFAPFASAKALIKNGVFGEDEIIPLIDIGARRTSIVIVNGNDIQLSRIIDLGGYQLTQAFASGSGLSVTEAEKLKREKGFVTGESESAEQKAHPQVQQVLDDLVENLKRSFAYIEREFLSQKMKKILICGGGALMPGLKEYLGEKTGLPVESMDAFSGSDLKMTVKGEDKEELKPLLSSAIGEVI